MLHPIITEHSRELRAALYAKTKINKKTNCLLYLGATTGGGYGLFTKKLDYGIYFMQTAHVAAWCLAFGAPADGQHVLHRCDNRKCINLDHLWLGTNAENVADKMAKGRHPRGSQFQHAKLTEAKVATLLRERASGASAPKLAKKYGVTLENIMSIVKGRTWKHVHGPREATRRDSSE